MKDGEKMMRKVQERVAAVTGKMLSSEQAAVVEVMLGIDARQI